MIKERTKPKVKTITQTTNTKPEKNTGIFGLLAMAGTAIVAASILQDDKDTIDKTTKDSTSIGYAERVYTGPITIELTQDGNKFTPTVNKTYFHNIDDLVNINPMTSYSGSVLPWTQIEYPNEFLYKINGEEIDIKYPSNAEATTHTDLQKSIKMYRIEPTVNNMSSTMSPYIANVKTHIKEKGYSLEITIESKNVYLEIYRDEQGIVIYYSYYNGPENYINIINKNIKVNIVQPIDPLLYPFLAYYTPCDIFTYLTKTYGQKS